MNSACPPPPCSASTSGAGAPRVRAGTCTSARRSWPACVSRSSCVPAVKAVAGPAASSAMTDPTIHSAARRQARCSVIAVLLGRSEALAALRLAGAPLLAFA